MLTDWTVPPVDARLLASREAMCRAAEIVAGRAEALAAGIEDGMLPDHGGPDALRLLAAVVRMALPLPACAGHG